MFTQRSHLRQWRKQLFALGTVFLSLTVNQVRCSTQNLTSFQIKRCSEVDLILIAAYLLTTALLTLKAVSINNAEAQIKANVGASDEQAEIYKGDKLRKLLIYAFFGGFISGAFGMGGGSVFCPCLIELGVAPYVTSATGMYMVLLSTFYVSLFYLSHGVLNLEYGIWLGILAVAAVTVGIFTLDHFIRQYRRQSIIVYLLFFVLSVSAVVVPVTNLIETRD